MKMIWVNLRNNYLNFHAIYTKPLQEFKVRDELCLLKIPYFLPVQLKTEIKRRQRVVICDPLFPNYIFAGIETDDDWNATKACKGVSYILQNDGKPAIIPNRTIEVLKMAEKSGAFDMRAGKSKFQSGDNVEILTGPFTGLIAKVQSASPRKRVKILMKLLGAEVPTELGEQDLKEAV